MTGGQMASTTLLDQITTTIAPSYGRDIKMEGYPIKMSEMLALVKGAVYIERTAVSSPANIKKTKRLFARLFKYKSTILVFLWWKFFLPVLLIER